MKPLFLSFTIILSITLRSDAEQPPAYERFDILTAAGAAHSRNPEWKPGEGLTLEVSGMDWTADGRLAVTIRKGEVWFLDNVEADSVEEITYHRFASGLHEPLGILRDEDSFLVAQRAEITRLRDTDGDDIADEYLTAASGWNVSGNYHAYIYGPERDGDGNLWVTTNLDMGNLANNDAAWRGWGMTINPDTSLTPQAAGMRSPCGIGANLEGDLFFSDQQGSWIPTTPIYHLRKGAFYGNPEGIASQQREESPLQLSAELPLKHLYPEAVQLLPELVPPAVWLPYDKMGRSATDIQVIDQDGQFGPFDGQLLVGEFTNSSISRVFLEKVDGEYQGVCFPFLSKFPAAVFRLEFGPDGSLYVGMTNRGWSSLGSRSYGLQRVRWNGHTPFAIQEMRATSDGFELVFTEPVDPQTAADPESYELSSYTYRYQGSYGGPEEDVKALKIEKAEVSDDGLRVRLVVEGLREMYVHELRASGIRTKAGKGLEHPDAYYTLNRIPES